VAQHIGPTGAPKPLPFVRDQSDRPALAPAWAMTPQTPPDGETHADVGTGTGTGTGTGAEARPLAVAVAATAATTAGSPTRRRLDDLRGASRLAIDATLGVTGVAEQLHAAIARIAPPLVASGGSGRAGRAAAMDAPGGPAAKPIAVTAPGVAGLVYRSVRGVTRLVGQGLDLALGQWAKALGPAAGERGPELEAVVAALNGVFGDHLVASGNPLALPMRLLLDGRPLVAYPALACDPASPADPAHLAACAQALAPLRARAGAQARVTVFVHGLCMHAGQWARAGQDHRLRLEQAGAGLPLSLHYNTGRHISDNGADFAGLLEGLFRALQQAWPGEAPRLVLVGHSMGGLVIRSACAQAEAAAAAAGTAWPAWRTHLAAAAFLGSPHQGAPLERGGKVLDGWLGASPYTAGFMRLGRGRSAGITDLGHGCLLAQDWAEAETGAEAEADPAAPSRVASRPGPAHRADRRRVLPLPAGVRCVALAGTLGDKPTGVGARAFGDGLVPLTSALGQHRDPDRRLAFAPGDTRVLPGVHHFDLLSDEAAGQQLVDWLGVPAPR